LFTLLGSTTQSAMKAARSSSEIGLQAAKWPSPNMTYGPPFFTLSTCPARDLKNAVGRTIEYVMSEAAFRSASKASLAFWNSRSGFWTQIAERRMKWLAPAARAAVRQFLVACSERFLKEGRLASWVKWLHTV
jgi:hypothetical protein